MRYVLAIAALVLSGVLLLLGIGQRTFLAGPSEIAYPIDAGSDASYAVVHGEELAKVHGQANIVVSGENAFVAVGATRDVEGWTAAFDHAELQAEPSEKQLVSTLVPAEAQDAGDDEATEGDPGSEGAENTGENTENPADAPAEENADAPAEENADAPADENADATRADGGPEPLDPRGSDLWLEERTIDASGSGVETDTLRVPVALDETQAVLIATDGAGPLPEQVSVVWAQDRDTPWAGPLLVAGGVFGLLGGILYLLAIDHDRRGLGPRRGRRGPLLGIRNMFGRRKRAASATREPMAAHRRGIRRATIPALGLAFAIGLTGCSASYWPDFSPTPTEEPPEETPAPVSPVPVTDAQLERIVSRVAEVAGEADDSLDAEALAERFTGDALAQRAANYKIRSSLPDYSVVPPRLTDKTLDYELLQSTDTWPRTLLVTVASEAQGGEQTKDEENPEEPVDPEAAESDQQEKSGKGASPSLALVLTQETAHDNYLVSRVIALRGGISMTQAAPAEEGAALLADDLETLALPPGEVGSAYAAILQGGQDVPEADSFDLTTDTLTETYGKVLAEQAQQKADSEEKALAYSVAVAQGGAPVVALSTGMGGALVATTIIEEQAVDGSAGTFRPQATDVVTALSGLEGQQERLVQEVAHQLLFFVPSKADGAKIELLGVTSEIVGARN